MDATKVAQAVTADQPNEARKPYVAPAFKRLTPEAAKELLLEKGDLTDPGVKQMLQCIEDLHNGSGSDCGR